jgi:hypothetical protein
MINRIPVRVEILVEGQWRHRIDRVHGPAATCGRVEVAGAVVVEAEGWVVLLAGEAGGVDEIAEGVVVVANSCPRRGS